MAFANFVKQWFHKNTPPDLKGFKSLRSDAYSEFSQIQKYFDNYAIKKELLDALVILSSKKDSRQKTILISLRNILNADIGRNFTGLVSYIIHALTQIKEEYEFLTAAIKDQALAITKDENTLKELEQKEYKAITALQQILEGKLLPILKAQKEFLSTDNIEQIINQKSNIISLLNEEGRTLVYIRQIVQELIAEIIQSIKIAEVPIEIRIPGSANELKGFQTAEGTFLRKKSGGEKYPGKAILIEQRSEYGGVLFSQHLGLRAPTITLDSMTPEEMNFINTHEFISNKDAIYNIISSKKMNVAYIENTKPLFDVRGEVKDVMRGLDPGYLFAWPPKSQQEMILLFFLDVFISNYDRHGKNIMVDSTNNIFPIDPAMGFNTVNFVAKSFSESYGYPFTPNINLENYKSFLYNSFTRYILCVQTASDLKWAAEHISSKFDDATIRTLVGRMYELRPKVEFLPPEKSIYASSDVRDLSHDEMISILISRRNELLSMILNWDTFSRQVEVFDLFFDEYMKKGKVSDVPYTPQYCTFRDHAMIRKVFYDNKAPIKREDAIRSYYEEQQKKYTTQDVIKTVISDYSTSHEEPCKLEAQIRKDHELALRNRDSVSRTLLSVIISDIKYAELRKRDEQVEKIDFRKRLSSLKSLKIKLNDDEIMLVVFRRIKENKDMIEKALQVKRTDMIIQCETDNKLLHRYVPRQLEDDELKNIITAYVAESGNNANPGIIIGRLMKEYKGKVDGKKVNMFVSEVLQRAA